MERPTFRVIYKCPVCNKKFVNTNCTPMKLIYRKEDCYWEDWGILDIIKVSKNG